MTQANTPPPPRIVVEIDPAGFAQIQVQGNTFEVSYMVAMMNNFLNRILNGEAQTVAPARPNLQAVPTPPETVQ